MKDKAANGQFLVVEFGLVHSDVTVLTRWQFSFCYSGLPASSKQKEWT